jgi:hypothetical protein
MIYKTRNKLSLDNKKYLRWLLVFSKSNLSTSIAES